MTRIRRPVIGWPVPVQVDAPRVGVDAMGRSVRIDGRQQIQRHRAWHVPRIRAEVRRELLDDHAAVVLAACVQPADQHEPHAARRRLAARQYRAARRTARS